VSLLDLFEPPATPPVRVKPRVIHILKDVTEAESLAAEAERRAKDAERKRKWRKLNQGTNAVRCKAWRIKQALKDNHA
jgi:hypothetical protein